MMARSWGSSFCHQHILLPLVADPRCARAGERGDNQGKNMCGSAVRQRKFSVHSTHLTNGSLVANRVHLLPKPQIPQMSLVDTSATSLLSAPGTSARMPRRSAEV